MENPIQVLKDDQKRLIGLFRQFEGERRRAPEMLRGIANEIFMEIEIHCVIEERSLYPAIQINPSAIDQNTRDHQEIFDLIAQLRDLDPSHQDFTPLFDELQDTVEAYFLREEQEVFMPADKQLGASAGNGLADKMIEMRSELMRLPQYRNALPEVVQNPNGGEQKRKSAESAA